MSSRSAFRRTANELINNVSRKAVAVARNYVSHAQEMGHTGTGDTPVLFIKPSTSYLRPGNPIRLPPGAEVHYEVELGVVIGKTARNVSVERARDFVLGYFCALDLTARNWQKRAKEKGEPWEISKALDGFLAVSDVVERGVIEKLGGGGQTLWLEVNGVQKQRESTDNMIWSVDELLSFASRRFTLERGDLLITGTPAGVGPLVPNDVVKAGVGEVISMEFKCELNDDWID